MTTWVGGDTPYYAGGNNFCPNGCVAYVLYWADTQAPGTPNRTQFFHNVVATVPSGNMAICKILQRPNQANIWDITIDIPSAGFHYTAVSTITGGSYVIRTGVGGEFSGSPTSGGNNQYAMWRRPRSDP